MALEDPVKWMYDSGSITMARPEPNPLLEQLEDLWEIVKDLVFDAHDSCYNCQPYEGGVPLLDRRTP